MPKIPSINISKPAPTATAAPVADNQLKQNSPFTADQLLDAWVGLKAHFPKEERLLAMLAENKPTIVGENQLRLTLVSPLQKDEFNRFKKEILSIVRKTLHNDVVTLDVQVQTYIAEQKAFTAVEKYKQMAAAYPELVQLKNDLSLQIE